MKKVLRVLVVLVVIGAAAGGYWYWRNLHRTTNDKLLVVFGNIDVRQVELAINDNERIAELLVEEGDRIKKGQLLAKLELDRFELAVARAKAQIEMQTQVVARLEAGSRKEEIAKARADLLAAQATVWDAETTYNRKATLLKREAATQQEVDDTKAAFESAEAPKRPPKRRSISLWPDRAKRILPKPGRCSIATKSNGLKRNTTSKTPTCMRRSTASCKTESLKSAIWLRRKRRSTPWH